MSLGSVVRGVWLLSLVLCGTAIAERRHALLVGANLGWASDQPLRHARDDAHRLAATLTSLGDFAPGDVTVLEDPTTEQLLATLSASVNAAKDDPGLFVFFYSGHSDAEYVHLQGVALRLDALYAQLKTHPARVKVALFDSCQSGSLLAAKGGRLINSFEVKLDDSLAVQGTAVLASSGADELSQEARALKGSYFTHHLISGLRGAADDNRDARVSLQEAYEYAANRTTLSTAGSAAGAQRPVFRYELKGRGDVYLTKLNAGGTVLEFAADASRCFVTDDAERVLLAEVPGGVASRVEVPPGGYLVKCPVATGYRVAALMAGPGTTVQVKGLPFRELPLSAGVLKGSLTDPQAEDPSVGLRNQGFTALRDGQADRALEAFNLALARDLRDAEAYRGKAQAYLMLGQAAWNERRYAEADQLRTAAVRADPRLADDPEYRRLLPGPQGTTATQVMAGPAGPPPPLSNPLPLPDAKALAQKEAENAHPREFQGWGVGVAGFNPHGPLVISVEHVWLEWLQASLSFSPLVVGFGASVKGVPRAGNWSPYLALGGGVTLAGLGLIDGPSFQLTGGATPVTRTTFDRLVYAEAGLQAVSRHWQFELGVAVVYSAPVAEPSFFSVMPSISLRYFF